MRLKGKRALVTGGTKGIGEAVVTAFREAGTTVLTTACKFQADKRTDYKCLVNRHGSGNKAWVNTFR